MRLKPLALAVDDDEFFRKAIEAVLPRLGLDVKGVADSSSFLKLAESLKPDLYSLI